MTPTQNLRMDKAVFDVVGLDDPSDEKDYWQS